MVYPVIAMLALLFLNIIVSFLTDSNILRGLLFLMSYMTVNAIIIIIEVWLY